MKRMTLDGYGPILYREPGCSHLSGQDLPTPENRVVPIGAFARCKCGEWFVLKRGDWGPYWRKVSRRKKKRLDADWENNA